MYKFQRNTTGHDLPFHGITIPDHYYYGIDNDKPFVSSGAHPIPGVVFVYRLSRNGNWRECREQGALARALHRQYWRDQESDRIAADREARTSGYTSMSEVKNPSGHIHFT